MKNVIYLLMVSSLLVYSNSDAQVRVSDRPLPRQAQALGAVQGSIVIADNNLAQQLLAPNATKIVLEVWQVNYAQDKTNQNSTDILLRQKMAANVQIQVDQNNLKYNIQNVPTVPNLIVLAYLAGADGKLKILGRPFYGQGASIGHPFVSDAKKHTGQGAAYGIYSLEGSSANLTNIDFRITNGAAANCKNCDLFGDIGGAVGDIVDGVGNFVKKTINGVEHVFDQTINGISGLSKCVVNDIQGIADATNFFINEAGQYFYLTGAGLINLVLYGNLPRTRDISNAEYAWANQKIFNNTLPPINQIKIFNFMHLAGDGHRYFTWPSPTGSYIYVNIGDAFDNSMGFSNSRYPAPGQVFIHELTHAWQCGKYGLIGMAQRYFSTPGGLNQTYDPGCATNSINSSYNFEQQATLVDASYAMLYYPGLSLVGNCGFSINWTEKNIRNGATFDMAKLTAANEMMKVAGLVNGVADGQAVHSNGNKLDGDGYFMLGRNTNSFIYYSNKTRAATVNWGVIRDRFTKANYEFGELGWPMTNEVLLPDRQGYFQKFDHGFIYWHPKYGAYAIPFTIFDPWSKQGWETGKLGYPISDYIAESPTTGYQKFVGGVIFFGQQAQPNASVRYGNPNIILSETRKPGAVLRDQGAINPQPLPPRVPRVIKN